MTAKRSLGLCSRAVHQRGVAVVIDRRIRPRAEAEPACCSMSQTGQQVTFERGPQREAAMVSFITTTEYRFSELFLSITAAGRSRINVSARTARPPPVSPGKQVPEFRSAPAPLSFQHRHGGPFHRI